MTPKTGDSAAADDLVDSERSEDDNDAGSDDESRDSSPSPAAKIGRPPGYQPTLTPTESGRRASQSRQPQPPLRGSRE